MRAVRRATVMVVAGLVVFGAAAPAHADAKDDQFISTVTQMGIPFPADTDVPAVGKGVCDMLNQGLSGNPNPVPVVRGVINKLKGTGLDRSHAAALMQASVAVYCPQHARFTNQ